MYSDMGEFIFSRTNKTEILRSLSASDSPFAQLYRDPYPTTEKADALWNEFEEKYLRDCKSDFRITAKTDLSYGHQFSISEDEAKAVVNWIYQAYPNSEERKTKTYEILPSLSRVFETEILDFYEGIIYVKSSVEINVINSFSKFCNTIQGIGSPKHTFYFRGHSDTNYVLLPSVMRKPSWLEHERDMYNETLIECPQEFYECQSHLDRLVHMQHYGLPTRLLDITRNPLVALYFACESNPKKHGEIIVFDVNNEDIKYPGSDTVSILASLPLFTQDMKENFFKWASDVKLSYVDFNAKAIRLLHEIKLEKPAFRDEIKKETITSCFFVLSEKKNHRIIKQDGAFIICGLIDPHNNPINQYRYKNGFKIQIYLIEASAKKSIMEFLNKLSINKAHLFPEISDVTDFIKNKY